MENNKNGRGWRPGGVTTLAGGVGAAKLLTGLAAAMEPSHITVIANTGDDIELHGLRICPDIDTVVYTLAGMVDPERGWGVQSDSFECLNWLGLYGGPTWFNLGDRDLATHIRRTSRLAEGASLSQVTEEMTRAHGVESRVLPMTDSYSPTMVRTEEGRMHLQEYLVRRRCEPAVRAIEYEGIERTRPAAGVLESIAEAELIIVCPSNPFISIGPILAVPGIREALVQSTAPIAAVSPIVSGKAIKGPAATMLRDLGFEVSAIAVAQMYREFARIFVLDRTDAALAPLAEDIGMRAVVTNTIMENKQDKKTLAEVILKAAMERL
jgi:LPPG:FO 2-phospho-L-lactate transferase